MGENTPNYVQTILLGRKQLEPKWLEPKWLEPKWLRKKKPQLDIEKYPIHCNNIRCPPGYLLNAQEGTTISFASEVG